MNDVAHKVNLHATKKVNIIPSGFLTPLTDAGIVTNFLCDELGIDSTVVCCTHLGKLSANVNQPSLLLITLLPDDYTRVAICSAKTLRTSTDIRNHIFLNADLMPE